MVVTYLVPLTQRGFKEQRRLRPSGKAHCAHIESSEKHVFEMITLKVCNVDAARTPLARREAVSFSVSYTIGTGGTWTARHDRPLVYVNRTLHNPIF